MLDRDEEVSDPSENAGLVLKMRLLWIHQSMVVQVMHNQSLRQTAFVSEEDEPRKSHATIVSCYLCHEAYYICAEIIDDWNFTTGSIFCVFYGMLKILFNIIIKEWLFKQS